MSVLAYTAQTILPLGTGTPVLFQTLAIDITGQCHAAGIRVLSPQHGPAVPGRAALLTGPITGLVATDPIGAEPALARRGPFLSAGTAQVLIRFAQAKIRLRLGELAKISVQTIGRIPAALQTGSMSVTQHPVTAILGFRQPPEIRGQAFTRPATLTWAVAGLVATDPFVCAHPAQAFLIRFAWPAIFLLSQTLTIPAIEPFRAVSIPFTHPALLHLRQLGLTPVFRFPIAIPESRVAHGHTACPHTLGAAVGVYTSISASAAIVHILIQVEVLIGAAVTVVVFVIADFL